MPDGAPKPPLTDARTRVLDAAEAIIQTRGVSGLTLEAAARDAGVSKGGLLYHFASKEALLDGMLRRLAGLIEQEYRAGVAAQQAGRGRVARAMIHWAFGEGEHTCDDRHDRAAAVFLAAFHHDPVLLDPIREVIAVMRGDLAADGLPDGVGDVINAAGDGMFMARLFRLYTPTQDERVAMRATLHGLLDAAR